MLNKIRRGIQCGQHSYKRDIFSGKGFMSTAALKTFELKGTDDSNVIQYSRKHIPNDQEMAPCTLTGFKRSVFLVLYAAHRIVVHRRADLHVLR